MRNCKLIITCLIIELASFSGCVPASFFNGKYFGKTYTATSTVSIYYDAKDIKQPYYVIGHFAAPLPLDKKSRDDLPNIMIGQAKKVGADGLIFSQLFATRHDGFTDYSLNAEAIKFTR